MNEHPCDFCGTITQLKDKLIKPHIWRGQVYTACMTCAEKIHPYDAYRDGTNNAWSDGKTGRIFGRWYKTDVERAGFNSEFCPQCGKYHR